jgi:magnesium transporter
MIYLSQLLGAAVENEQGVRVGKIVDVLVDVPTAAQGTNGAQVEARTRVPTVVVEGDEEQRWHVPASAMRHGEGAWQVPPASMAEASGDETTPEQQVSLAHEVLNKHVIDVAHKKVVRVNDVGFSDDWRVLGIDNSAQGLLRSLAPAWLLGGRNQRHQRTSAALIPWEQIELIGETRAQEEPEDEDAHKDQSRNEEAPTLPAALSRRTSGQLAELRPADIADIIYQLTPGQGARLLEGFDNETAAEVLEELDTERQSQIFENISAERAADILQEMGPDEAADLVSSLQEERAQE